jgi:mannosyl-3-phosphoglycerate phosphatase
MGSQLVVFSDLDATLLDHHDYSFEAATEALSKLKTNNIPLVLNSSKTMPEMKHIRSKLDNQHPFIIENGAGLLIPPNYFENNHEKVINFSTEYRIILDTLSALREQGFMFRHFNMLTAEDVSDLTSLSVADAKMAKERFGSEPLLWDDTEENLKLFTKEIQGKQLKLIKGGRFYHVIGLFDKGYAIEKALTFFEKKYLNQKIVSIGLGDSPNDIPMLETVDIAIVIKSGRSSEMILKNTNCVFSKQEGSAGWNEEILTLLEKQGV